MAAWIIRGGSDRGLHEEEFIESESIGIYFGAKGTARKPDDELRAEIRSSNLLWNEERGIVMEPSRVDGIATRFFNQVLLFRDSVQPGDTVIMPRKKSKGHLVRRGVIQGGYEFWPNEVYPHQRRVKWEAEDMPRGRVPYSWYPSNQQTIFKVA